jgi:hypothetical protein
MRSTPLMRVVMLVAIVALLPVAAGCGSSKKSTALSKAEFLKRGNAICRRGNQEINRAAQKIFPNSHARPNQADEKKFATNTLIPSVQGQIDGIKALGAPKGDESKVKAIVTSAQTALEKGKKNPLLLTSNKQDPFANTNKLAKAYGLTVCGSGG